MPVRLLVKNLGAHPVRTLLTILSLTVAVFLICTLQGLLTGLNAGVAGSASNRLIVQSAVSLFVSLPLSYQSKIEGVPGVSRTTKFQWFGGIYRDPSNFFAQFGVDSDRFFEVYPEVDLIAGSKEAFLAKPTACVVGRRLAERYGWKVGDRIPLIGTIFPRNDGRPWEFEVAGVFVARSPNVDESTLFFDYDYLDEALEAGATGGPRGVGVYVLDIAGDADPVNVAAAVDALFENGPQRVQTTTEAEFQRQFVSMLGSIPTLLGSIGGGVLFAIVLAVLNTMLMAGRERTRDFGVLKALGFPDGTVFALLLGEALLIGALGGGLGVSLALLSEPALAEALRMIVPAYEVTRQTTAFGFGLSLAVGLLAGLFPAWLASRLECVEALRAEV